MTLVSEDTDWGLYWCNFGDWWYHNKEMKMGVIDMEVDKVADEMADMEIDMKVAPPCGQIFNWRKWRHLVAKFSTKESASTWWPNFQIMHVAPPSGQISNNCMWRHLEAKFPTYASQADWWPYFQQLQVVSLGGKAKLWFWQYMILRRWC